MTQVNIHEVKTHLSRLLGLVATGEEVGIAKAGKPVAHPRPRRPLGLTREKTLATVLS